VGIVTSDSIDGLLAIALIGWYRFVLVVEAMARSGQHVGDEGLEAGVLEFRGNAAEEVCALPLLVGIPELQAIPLLDVKPGQFLDVAHDRSKLGRLKFGESAFRFCAMTVSL
jgi:hypothetical protein